MCQKKCNCGKNLEISQPFLNKYFSFERQKLKFKDNSFSEDFTRG